ncbi:hypothetical protein GUJ93_ZPchr0002g22979 [Zizania palustris]|uniref:Uncharacterized protein n=1 Tax=Zizania palustris TaxID=103762 RepID=A0A8J5S2N6_ZIZPA|nr:hypothetical protein GUJ93_ZPchr0002g22979 [Zizania palustris]
MPFLCATDKAAPTNPHVAFICKHMFWFEPYLRNACKRFMRGPSSSRLAFEKTKRRCECDRRGGIICGERSPVMAADVGRSRARDKATSVTRVSVPFVARVFGDPSFASIHCLLGCGAAPAASSKPVAASSKPAAASSG